MWLHHLINMQRAGGGAQIDAGMRNFILARVDAAMRKIGGMGTFSQQLFTRMLQEIRNMYYQLGIINGTEIATWNFSTQAAPGVAVPPVPAAVSPQALIPQDPRTPRSGTPSPEVPTLLRPESAVNDDDRSAVHGGSIIHDGSTIHGGSTVNERGTVHGDTTVNDSSTINDNVSRDM